MGAERRVSRHRQQHACQSRAVRRALCVWERASRGCLRHPVWRLCARRASGGACKCSAERGHQAALTEDQTPPQTQAEPQKYYRTVPGFPGVMVEYDEPEPPKKERGPVKWWAVALLVGGVALMFTEAATFTV